MGTFGSERLRPIGVSLPGIQVMAIEFVGCKDPRNLPRTKTLIEFAEGREVFGCKTISEAVSLYRKDQKKN